MGNIYDGAFRTILNDCRKLIIPIINEVFGEEYTGEEKIQFFPNEHFLDQQDKPDKERITDTNFRIIGKDIKKYHIESESSYPDSNEQKLKELKAEYQIILEKLNELEQQRLQNFKQCKTVVKFTSNSSVMAKSKKIF